MPPFLALPRTRPHTCGLQAIAISHRSWRQMYGALRQGEANPFGVEARFDALAQVIAHSQIVGWRHGRQYQQPHPVLPKVDDEDGKRWIGQDTLVLCRKFGDYLAYVADIFSIIHGQREVGAHMAESRIVDDATLLHLAVG